MTGNQARNGPYNLAGLHIRRQLNRWSPRWWLLDRHGLGWLWRSNRRLGHWWHRAAGHRLSHRSASLFQMTAMHDMSFLLKYCASLCAQHTVSLGRLYRYIHQDAKPIDQSAAPTAESALQTPFDSATWQPAPGQHVLPHARHKYDEAAA